MAEYTEGQVLRDPKTGHTIIFRGGNWVDNDTAPASKPAPFASAPESPGAMEDVGRTIIPSAIRGTTAAVTAPATLGELGADALFKGAKSAAEFGARGVGEALFGKGQEIGQWFADKDAAYAKTLERDKDRFLKTPTYSNIIGGIENKLGGGLYEPQTKPGKYARTVIETIPAIGSMGANVPKLVQQAGSPQMAKALLGAAGSEAAGQATEGSWFEPWARALGMGASAAPSVARGIVSPGGNADKAFMKVSKEVGEHVKLPAGVATDSPFMTKMEGALMPYWTPKRMRPEVQQADAAKAANEMIVHRNLGLKGSTASQALHDAWEAAGKPRSGGIDIPTLNQGLSAVDKKTKLGRFAEGAEGLGVGKPLPAGSLTDIPGVSPALAAAGALAGWKYGGNPLYALLGGGAGARPVIKAAEQVAGPVAAGAVLNPLTQKYLRNQAWTPSAATAADPALMAKLLAAQGGPTYDNYFYPIE